MWMIRPVFGSQLRVIDGRLFGRVGILPSRWGEIRPPDISAVREHTSTNPFLGIVSQGRTFYVSGTSRHYDDVVHFLVQSGREQISGTLAHRMNALLYRRQFSTSQIFVAAARYVCLPLTAVDRWVRRRTSADITSVLDDNQPDAGRSVERSFQFTSGRLLGALGLLATSLAFFVSPLTAKPVSVVLAAVSFTAAIGVLARGWRGVVAASAVWFVIALFAGVTVLIFLMIT